MAIFIIILFSLLIISFFVFKIGDVFSPWMISVGVWLAILILSFFPNDFLYPIGSQFYNCLLLWVPIFTFFSIATFYALPSRENSNKLENTTLNKRIFMFFFIISLIFTPLIVYKVFKTVSMFGPEDVFANIRNLAVLQSKSGDDEGILKYINTMNKSLYVVALWNVKKLGKPIFFTILAINILYAFSVMEKGFIFFLIFTTLFVLYAREKVKIRTIVFWCVFVIFMFYGFNIIRSNVDSDQYDTFGQFFASYVLSPAVAFGKTEELLNGQFGTRTFTFIYSFLNKVFSCDFIIIPKLQDFVWVSIPTNVYTIFQPFFQDFGYKGIAFFASFYGVFIGVIYRLYMNGDKIMRCVYAYIVYILVLQFFQEHLIVSFSVFLQYLILFTFILQQKYKISFTGFKKLK